jgi:hypothetical protein
MGFDYAVYFAIVIGVGVPATFITKAIAERLMARSTRRNGGAQ